MPEDVIGRIRDLENKIVILRDRIFVTDKNMIEEYKNLNLQLRNINQEIKEVKADLTKIKQTIKHMVQEIDAFARKDDLKVLEKYINLWNPLNFITEKEVNIIIKKHVTEGKINAIPRPKEKNSRYEI